MGPFHPMLQKDIVNERRLGTRDEFRDAVITWIENTFNRCRRQLALEKLAPIDYELALATDHIDLAA